MRIDKLLDVLCIVKHRSIAKKACDNNLVQINGATAKPSKLVQIGDRIRVAIYGFIIEFELTDMPTKNIQKSQTTNYYKLVVRNQEPD
ncbi:MAG: S4 domain-containing protein [Candidatus Cloacimonadota bacterium]|nr:S4 domain-containing protein [Candidatus Cloacimonadota bacterium]